MTSRVSYRFALRALLLFLLVFASVSLTPGHARSAAAVDTTGVLTAWQFTPAQPQEGQVVSLHLVGRMAFACPTVAEVAVAPGEQSQFVHLTLSPNSGCSDTAHVWTYDAALGTPAAGGHDVLVLLLIEDGTSSYHVPRFLHYEVSANSSVPPLPPRDSLRLALSPAVPSPFRGGCRLAVSLASAGNAELEVLDAAGRRVRVVHRGALPRGTTELHWDGRDAQGQPTASGVYFARLTLADRVVSRRLVRLAER